MCFRSQPFLSSLVPASFASDASLDFSLSSRFAQPVIDRQIPWALVFGNHDDQDDYSRAELMNAASHMPYSLSRAGPADVDGVGNYLLKIYSGDA